MRCPVCGGQVPPPEPEHPYWHASPDKPLEILNEYTECTNGHSLWRPLHGPKRWKPLGSAIRETA